MKKQFRIIAVIMCGIFMLSGCAIIPDMNLTEEEEKQIVGYSANVLLKYVKNHNSNLVDTSEARELAAKVEALKELKAEEAADSSGSAEDGSGSVEDGTVSEGTQDIAQALGVPGFSISYQGCEVCATYPNDGTTDEFFNMAASMGNELMVFHFNIENTSDSDADCDILDNDPIFRMIMNGNDRKNGLTTLLLDDMATINETIPAGESIGAVVVVEVPEGYDADISSVDFVIKCGDSQSTIPIQ